MSTKIQLRRDTLANWLKADPILKNGEAGYVYDNRRMKVGDGKTPWSKLPYATNNSDTIKYLEELIETKQNKLTADNAGDGISITTDEYGRVKINNTRVSAEWGNITGEITDQTDLVEYIETYGGKIDKIKRNGVELEIVDKTVDIDVPTASDEISYSFEGQSFTNVQETLDMLLNRIYYANPSYTAFKLCKADDSEISYSLENGDSVTISKVKWTLNKQPTNVDTMKLTGMISHNIMTDETIADKKNGTYVLETPITINVSSSSKSMTISYHDSHSTKPSGSGYTLDASSTKTISFTTYKYCGVSDKEILEDSDIRALELKTDASKVTIDSTHIFNCGDGKYLYYCIPTANIPSKGITFSLASAGGSFNPASGNYFEIIKNDFVNGAGKNIPLTIYKFKKSADGNPVMLTGQIQMKVETKV